MKIVLTNREPGLNPSSEELALIIIERIGLVPRKKGSTDKMHHVLIELYERSKQAHRTKEPELGMMTVEEMGTFAGITRQTMYDYLKRWLEINLIVKTSYFKGTKIMHGYRLNGPTLEAAFEKCIQTVHNNLDTTMKYIQELQKVVKNEKIKRSQQERVGDKIIEQ
ncbi:hypothetical protein HYW21_08820 [Candidatus Woesearchaeota archaeon]|nr:hypothetical protein [Candidatus Woesearchaeota archaeon]